MSRRASNVRRDGDEFIKRAPGPVQREAAKARAFQAAAATSGFRTTELLRADVDTGELRYRWIDGLVSVRESYLSHVTGSGDADRAPRLFEQIGRALARIHAHLELAAPDTWVPPPEMVALAERRFGMRASTLSGATPVANLHCDFGFSNVCVTAAASSPTLVIIDPSPNRFVTRSPELRGPVYVDVAHFCSCIEGLVPLRFLPAIDWRRVVALQEIFVSAYESEGRQPLDRVLLARMSYLTAACYLRQRCGGLVGRLGLSLLFNGWKGNLPR